MQYILTINPGSTAVKYAVFTTDGALKESREFSRKAHGEMASAEKEWLQGIVGVAGIGIRVVHGGALQGPLLVDTATILEIRKYKKYAPIHNAMALEVIKEVKQLWDVPMVASFDTDFHRTLPDYAYTYPIPTRLAKQDGIRRYGFHGLVLTSVLAQYKRVHGAIPKRAICVHIGGGSSVTAVANGRSLDTTMGLTPLEGVMMITRSGSVDPTIVELLGVEVLNTESGFYGLTGTKNTLQIIERAGKMHEPERLAVDIYVHQLVKAIGGMYTILGGCDALIFSGGIGAGNAQLRNMVLRKLKALSISSDEVFVGEADEARVLYENTYAKLGL